MNLSVTRSLTELAHAGIPEKQCAENVMPLAAAASGVVTNSKVITAVLIDTSDLRCQSASRSQAKVAPAQMQTGSTMSTSLNRACDSASIATAADAQILMQVGTNMS